MAEHESNPAPPGIRGQRTPIPTPANSPAPVPNPAPAGGAPQPSAWQPVTFRGVAAFSRARIGRVLIAQFVVALLVAASIVLFLNATWFPRGLEAIRALPATGVIENQVLKTPRASAESLAADAFIAFSVNLDSTASPGSVADVQVEFHRSHFTICSLLGCLAVDYPAGYLVQFNQPEMESWWGAWRWTMVTAVVVGTLQFLFLSWWLLATVYFPFVALAAFFGDRDVSLFGCWKLCAAALLMPALATGAAISCYGLGIIDLLRLLLVWLAHIPMGWVYVYFAVRQLPPAGSVATANQSEAASGPDGVGRTNPFVSPEEPPPPKHPKNPFQSS